MVVVLIEKRVKFLIIERSRLIWSRSSSRISIGWLYAHELNVGLYDLNGISDAGGAVNAVFIYTGNWR